MCFEPGQWKYGCLFKEIIELKGERMTDAMKAYYPEFSYIYPSFVACSTGYGKTFFALNEVFKELNNTSSLALYLSNRTATDLQAKKKYIEIMELDYLLETYTDKGLEQLDKIGNVYFLTYQKLYKIIQTSVKSKDDIRCVKFKMVYCDEAEYFTSDSTFNYSTSATLDFIVNYFQYSIKVYVSATPDLAFASIYSRELINFEKQKKTTKKGSYKCQDCGHTKFMSEYFCDGSRCIIDSYGYRCGASYYLLSIMDQVEIEFNPTLYVYIKDYDNVDFYCVNSNEEYLNYKYDKSNDEKTLLFVETKKIGKNTHDYIESLNKNSVYINAANKNNKGKSGNSFRNLITYETIDEEYGVFTSCLDAGINYVDDSLKNIVFSTIDKNQAIQMTGRKRLKDGERVNFVIVNKTKDELEKSLSRIRARLDAIAAYKFDKKQFKEDYYNGSKAKHNFNKIHGIFYLDDGVKYNDLAEAQLNYLESIVVGILDKMEKGDEYAYIKTVMSWFGRYDYNDDMWINYKPKEEYRNELVEFLNKSVGIIKRNKYEDFRKNFFEYFIPAYGLNANESKDEIFAINKINKKFNECNLKYILLSHKESYYSLRKLNEADALISNSTCEEDLIKYLDNNLREIEQDEYENFINNLVEKYKYAFSETRDVDMKKELTTNKINSMFKKKGLMYEFAKHSGTYYELQKIEEEEAEAKLQDNDNRHI